MTSSFSPSAPRAVWRRLAPALGVGALLVLLAVLASLQYRWLGQAAEADRARAEAGLRRDGERFAEDLRRELSRAMRELGRAGGTRETRAADSAADVLDAWATWRTTTDVPDLVVAIDRLRLPKVSEPFQIERLDAEAVAWVPLDDPALREALARRRFDDGGGIFLDDPLALLVPTRWIPPRRDESPRARTRARQRARALEGGELRVLRLERSVLERTLPDLLAARYFSGDRGLDARLRWVEVATGRTLWRAGPQGVAAVGTDESRSDRESTPPDVVIDVFGAAPPDPDRVRDRLAERRRQERRASRRDERRLVAGFERQPIWRLEVWPPGGSLDQAVARARRRSLALGLGVLAILGVAIVALGWTAARARRLAARQLDFVAGVTHELLTPLAALRSAGQNLADGVVQEPAQVARYGRLIDTEGGRLTTMVQQVLGFAAASRAAAPELESLSIQEVVERSLERLAPAIEAAGATVEVDLEEGLPRALGDAATVESSLQNLVGNALKHGRGPDGSIQIEIHATAGSKLRLDVADRGPGVAAGDQGDLFEPFVRGRGQAASALPGAGLGLALVARWMRAMGGQVRYAARSGGGARFSLLMRRARPIDTQATDGGGVTPPRSQETHG